MKEKKQNLIFRILLLCIVFISIAITIFLGFRRNIFHIDEVWSYALSNSVDGKFWFDWWYNGKIETDPLPDINDFFENWHDGSLFKEYITVQRNETFRYDIPYHYQAMDVSPPLYYMLIHTICSFFPETFSKWYGLIPNIIFLGLSIVVLYKIALKMLPNQFTALAATAFWAFSRAAFGDAVFIRMYMLGTLEVLFSFLLHAKWIENKESPDYKLLYSIFAVNVLGFLTQNYVYVITFFMAVVVCMVLLSERKWKQMIIFGLTELASVGTAILIFPAVISQMTSSTYAEQAKGSFFSGTLHNLWVILLQNFFGLEDELKEKIAGVIDSVGFCIVVAIVVFIIISRLKSTKAKNLALLFTTCICIGWFVCVSNPVMPYFQDRYYFMFLPLCFLAFAVSIVALFSPVVKFFHGNQKLVLIPEIILVVFGILANFGVENYFLFYEEGMDNMQEMLTGQTCFVLVPPDMPSYLIHNQAPWFQNAEKVYYSRFGDGRLNDAIIDSESCYYFVCDIVEDAPPEKIIETYSPSHEVEYLGHYFFNEGAGTYNIYHLSPRN